MTVCSSHLGHWSWIWSSFYWSQMAWHLLGARTSATNTHSVTQWVFEYVTGSLITHKINTKLSVMNYNFTGQCDVSLIHYWALNKNSTKNTTKTWNNDWWIHHTQGLLFVEGFHQISSPHVMGETPLYISRGRWVDCALWVKCIEQINPWICYFDHKCWHTWEGYRGYFYSVKVTFSTHVAFHSGVSNNVNNQTEIRHGVESHKVLLAHNFFLSQWILLNICTEVCAKFQKDLSNDKDVMSQKALAVFQF